MAQDINGIIYRERANIVHNLYYGKCTGKRDLTQLNCLFLQNMCRNLEFHTAEKIRLEKNQNFFAVGPVVFALRTKAYATEIKEYGIIQLSHLSN
jgi:3D (Asp-Asp-Asp) domain-containing protein